MEQGINDHGVEGRNIGLDFVNEYFNNEFKEIVKNCNGDYTKKPKRCSGMAGSFKQHIQKIIKSEEIKNRKTDLLKYLKRKETIENKLIRFQTLFINSNNLPGFFLGINFE